MTKDKRRNKKGKFYESGIAIQSGSENNT